MTPLQQAYWVGTHSALPLGQVPTQACFEYQTEELDVPRIEHALNTLVRAYPILRTISLPGGQQKILREVPHYPIPVHDLRDVSDPAAMMAGIRARAWSRPWSTGEWPRLDLTVHRLADADYRVLLRYDFSVLDLSGFAAILDRLSELYEDPSATLPVEPRSFRDYASASEPSTDRDEAKAYWDRRLDTLPFAPDLPLAMAPADVADGSFERVASVIGRASWHAIKEHGHRAGLTPSSILLAVYAEAIAFWSTADRFLLNLPAPDPRADAMRRAGVLGDFTKVLLVSADAPRAGTFLDRARALQEQVWSDLEHVAFDGVEVARELGRRRGSMTGVAPVVFTGLGAAAEARHLTRNALGTQIAGLSSTPQVWIDHQAREHDGVLMLNWDFVASLFPPGLVSDMAAASARLLESLVDAGAWQATFADTSRRMMPPAQSDARARTNDTHRAFEAKTLCTLARDSIRDHADRIALHTANRTITYREMGALAERAARDLREHGVEPGDVVAVVADKGWQQVVATLAVIFSGAAFVPVSPTTPLLRMEDIFAQCRARVALTTASLASRLAWPQGTGVCAVREDAPASDDAPSLPAPAPPPSAAAYLIFTSGSTGRPKGVMISHEAAVNTIQSINRRFEVTHRDCVLGLSDLSFDLAVWDIFGTIAAGGRLVLPRPDALREPEHWLELCVEHRVTIWNSVPQLYQALVRQAGSAARAPAYLRIVLLSGDWIPLDLPAKSRAVLPRTSLVSLGGATEASIWSITHDIGEIDPAWESVPYGTPLENQRCYVLNPAGADCPDWVAGELCIGGKGVALGYCGDAERTREQFTYSSPHGDRLYRTGDAARFHPAGYIQLLGRLDHQVKVNGFRVELGEIESVLGRHPAVRAAAAVAFGNPRGGRRLAAWAVSDGSVDAAGLRAHLAERLPSHMVPTTISLCADLPLTANGKIDRKELVARAERAEGPLQPLAMAEGDGRSQAPALVASLQAIWRELLEVGSVDTGSNFFDLGGDSILAMQVVSRAREGGIHVRTRDVLESKSLAELASRASAMSAGDQDDATGEVTVLPGQHWFLEQELLDAHLWHEGHVLFARGRADFEALERALHAVHEHHDALRSRFAAVVADDGSRSWTQFVGHRVPGDVVVRTRIAGRSSDGILDELGAVAESLQRGLDLANGPVLRAALVELGDTGRSAVVLVGHHLVVDGYSWRVIFEDLQSSYAQASTGKAISLPAKTASYKRWGETLRRIAESPEVQSERAYWERQVSMPSMPLPLDVDAEPLAENVRSVYTEVDPTTTRRLLHAVPPGLGLTPRDFILAAVFRALGVGPSGLACDVMMHGRPDVTEGVVVARTVGRFTTVFPAHLCLDPALGAAQQLQDVHAQFSRVPHDGFHYGLLRSMTGTREARGRLQSAARACFNYAGRFDHVLHKDGPFELLREVPRSQRLTMRGDRRYVLEWNTGIMNRALTIEWRFSENVHSRVTVERWAEACLGELHRLVGELAGP
jgi:amino acid adenylation domain-containing protein/non-ribosomal peptide synthase protein (TIGR01720 family)